MLTDPVADMLTRIRNANKALHESASMPSSRLKVEIAKILKEEGYIKDFHVVSSEDWNQTHEPKVDQRSFATLVVELKYGRSRERVITDLKRVSKPGRRVYSSIKDLKPVKNGLGISILSTPKGVMSDTAAREANVGGEVICRVY